MMTWSVPSLAVVAAFAVLIDCDFYPDEDDTEPVVLSAPDCDPVVYTAVGLNGGDPVPATPHAETLGADPDPFQVRIGSPSRDPSTSVSFLWRTDIDTLATVVEYAEGEDLSGDVIRLEGASLDFDAGSERIHEVKICGGLTPDTTYSYRVGFDDHWSSVYTFTTPASPRSFDTLRVAFAGDSRGAYTTWNSLVGLMEAHEPDLYLFSGDMVELGPTQKEWDAWFDATGDVLARKHFIPAHGNHEFLAQNYFAQFSLPRNEEWFSIDFGPLHVISLNDTVRDLADIDSRQPQYLESVLSTSDAPWKIAMHHRPGYSSCTRHGSDLEIRDIWYPVMENWGVNFVLSGHNHIYERSVPVKGEAEVADGQGTIYIVSGGAGAPLYQETEDSFFTAEANPIEHYIIMDLGPEQAEVVVYDRENNVIDEYTVSRE